MPPAPFDRRMLNPAPAEVAEALQEAVEKMNYRARVGRLEPKPKEFAECAERLTRESEGVRYWAAGKRAIRYIKPDDLLSLVAVAWWSDHMGRRHVRVAGRRLEREIEFHRTCFGPRNEEWPPVCLINPDRLFIRRLPGRDREVIAACRCGVIGPIRKMAWMGDECGPCFDERQAKEGRDPSAAPSLTVEGHPGAVTGIAFDDTGKTLISAGFGHGDDPWSATLRFTTLASGKLRCQTAVEDGSASTVPVRVAGNGKRVAVSGFGGVLLGEANGRKRPQYLGDIFAVDGVALAPDGTLAAISEGRIHIRREAKEATWDALPGSGTADDQPCSVAFSPDGSTLAYGLGRKTIELHELATRRTAVLADERLESPTVCLAFSPDGRRLLGATGDGSEWMANAELPGTVALWDVAHRELMWQRPDHESQAFAVAFSPDGTTAVSAGRDRAIRFWAAETGEPIGALEWHVGSVYAMAFSPDGDRLATGSGDGLVRMWPWRKLLETV